MNEKTRRRLDAIERQLRPGEPLPDLVVCFIRPDGTRAGERRIRIQPLPEHVRRT
jgi:hypothetical protein